MGNIADLKDEVRRCEKALARPIPLGLLGRLLTWWNRDNARRALEKAKAVLEFVAELEDSIRQARAAIRADLEADDG